MAKGLTTRAENYSERYNELVEQAGLAQKSDVRGCMVIKPYGFAIWEQIQRTLDTMFKNTGHVNAYFPLLIPKSYLSKEADHVEGFAKECAVVTHHRLRAAEGGGVEVDPEAKLEEELVVRPTSETIIWRTYKDWIISHRDLPLLINQRANVVRWEMRTRIFLRTAEFLRQEGHTAHATAEEAITEAQQMLDVYQDLLTNFLGIYAIPGAKSPSERFAGAVDTLTLEAMMQDGKALQSCTSHFLGQNFAKAFEVTFTNQENKSEHVRATSWGMSTRIMGALIMAHGDDQGLVLPPALAPYHVIFVPIIKSPEEQAVVEEYIQKIEQELVTTPLHITGKYIDWTDKIRSLVDRDDQKSPGRKFAEWELKGAPLRIAIGMRDIEAGKVEIARRDTGEKISVAHSEVATTVHSLLLTIQRELYTRHQQFTQAHTTTVDSWDEFQTKIEDGFVLAHWDGTAETEAKIKEETSATIRCIPFDQPEEAGNCIYTGKPSTKRVLFARSY